MENFHKATVKLFTKEEMINCEECKKEFVRKLYNQKYCSKECAKIRNLRQSSKQKCLKIQNGIKCAICGQMFKIVSGKHLRRHNITREQYKEKFPNIEMCSDSTRKTRKEARTNIDEKAAALKRKETKRKQRIEKYGELTPRQMQICYGGLLGDFGITGHTKRRLVSNRLYCGHGPMQIEYLKWKQNELKNFDCKYHEWTRYWEEYGREYTRRWIITAVHPAFTELRKFTYADGGFGQHRVVTKEWLDKLEPLGIAVWFMDDGCWSTRTCCIATEGFAYEQQKLIQEYFKTRWNIEVAIHKSGLGIHTKEQHYHLYINVESLSKWKELVGPYLLDMFKYKIGEKKCTM